MMLFVAGSLLSALLYLLLVGQLSADEIGLAAAGGLGAAFWAAVTRSIGGRHFRFERPAIRLVTSAIGKLPGAVAAVALALIRARRGAVIRQDFVRGRDLDPADAGRRAVVLLAVSLTPDKFALRLPPGRDQLEVHSVTGAPPAADIRWPR